MMINWAFWRAVKRSGILALVALVGFYLGLALVSIIGWVVFAAGGPLEPEQLRKVLGAAVILATFLTLGLGDADKL